MSEAQQSNEIPEEGVSEDIETDSLINSDATADTSADEVVEASEEQSPEEGADDEPKIWANKFKSVDELEKGYKEAVQKLREKTPGAPESYELDFTNDEELAPHADLLEGLDIKDDPRFQGMEDVFKKHNLSNETVSDLVKAQMLMDIQSLPDLEAEEKALGSDAELMIARANTFVRKNLDEEGQQMATQIGKTAAGVRFLDKMAQMVGEKAIPAQVTDDAPAVSSKELYTQAFDFKNNHPNFEANTTARDKYEQLLEKAIKAEAKEKGQ